MTDLELVTAAIRLGDPVIAPFGAELEVRCGLRDSVRVRVDGVTSDLDYFNVRCLEPTPVCLRDPDQTADDGAWCRVNREKVVRVVFVPGDSPPFEDWSRRE